MRVFVLGTGRCGTMTFAKACSHITNYTSGHETHRHHPERFPVYPDNHIEVDAHLAWMLGDLGSSYFLDEHAQYVHLTRNRGDVAVSFLHRSGAQMAASMMFQKRADTVGDMWQLASIIEANIRYFLRDKPQMKIDIDQAAEQWPAFWKWIGAEGDMEAGRKEFEVRYNANQTPTVVVPAGMNRMTLNPTWDCNRSCRNCGSRKMRDMVPGYQMSMEEIETFIRSTGDHRFESITLSGGEPLLWENLEVGVARLHEANITDKIVVFSNGTIPELFVPVIDKLDSLRLSLHDDNANEVMLLKDRWPSKVAVVDRRSMHIEVPSVLLPHDDVMPAECGSTCWMIYGGWAFACCSVPTVIAECGLNIETYPALMCKVEPGYLENLSPYVPACYELCRGCVMNHKVRKLMEERTCTQTQ